jgi:hypothetical protein
MAAAMKWVMPEPRWDTVAGTLLDAFFRAVRQELPDYDAPLTVFGSAAIQLCLDDEFASANVDLMVILETGRLRGIARGLVVENIGAPRPHYGLQICAPHWFRAAPHYLQRAWTGDRNGLRIVVPHVRDILLAKLHRSRVDGQEGLVAKDRRAFVRVRELCDGHPDTHDVLEDFVLCEPEFRVPTDGSVNSFRLNAMDLFREVFGRDLDLEREVLAPARAADIPNGGGDEPQLPELLSELDPDRD